MYEELIAELRLFETVCKHSNKEDLQNLAKRAADAIEELSKRNECPCWYGDMRFCSLLGKTLPQPPKEES